MVVETGAAHPLAVNEQTTISALEEMIDQYKFMVHAVCSIPSLFATFSGRLNLLQGPSLALMKNDKGYVLM